jgi:hypothetical protein
MGVVLKARQRRLDRSVAIKVLRPEQATATGTARFLAEARLLARLSHPNVVVVFDAGEADGLLYYVMEYVPGETLADRLKRGPLAPGELDRLAQDILLGLEAAHRLGVIHRDLKPSNIFLRDGRAQIGDFGLARALDDSDSSLTSPGQMIGTPRYMPPEQQAGREVTARSDVYAAAMILWECATGRVWPAGLPPGEADWRQVPGAYLAPLRRALALRPEQRFPDAAALRASLEGRPGIARAVRWGAVVIVLGMVALLALRSRRPARVPPSGAGFTLAVASFETGTGPGARALGDSIAGALAGYLQAFPDFRAFAVPRGATPAGAIPVEGTAVVLGDSIRLTLLPVATASLTLPASSIGSLRIDWRRGADSLAVSLARHLWQRQPDATGLAATLPRSGPGFTAWFKAERHWSRAEWELAGDEYAWAEQNDSTCFLCSYRLLDIARWLARERDHRRLARVVRVLDSFPDHYRVLIRAAATPMPSRLDTLRRAARDYSEFFLAPFEYGDELLHRGPLYGALEEEALEPLTRAVQLRPGFGPAREHLALLLIRKGDSAGARSQLAALGSPEEAGDFTATFRLFLELGASWRFDSPEAALARTRGVLAGLRVRANPLVAAGARLMMTIQAPRGAVALGRLLASDRRNPDAMWQGLLGATYGFAALGEVDSVLAMRRELARAGDPELPFLTAELAALLRGFDPESSLRRDEALERYFDTYLAPGVSSAPLRHRAAWVSGILAARTGQPARLAAARKALQDEAEPHGLGQFLAAAGRALAGDPAGALAQLPALPPLDAGSEPADLFEDTVAHLLRAGWLEQVGQLDEARRTLRWHEHMEVPGHGGGRPYAGEPAWAMGTLTAWLRLRLLDRIRERDPLAAQAERCAVSRLVVDGWADAPPPFRQRAATAQGILLEPSCGGTR